MEAILTVHVAYVPNASIAEFPISSMEYITEVYGQAILQMIREFNLQLRALQNRHFETPNRV